MATMILIFLPSFPFSATFITPRERAITQARLNRDHKPQSHGGMTGMAAFKAIISDLNAWLFMLIYASCTFFDCPTFVVVLKVEGWLSQCWRSHHIVFPAHSAYHKYLVHSIYVLTRPATQLIKGLGFSSINAQGLTVAPYAVGWFMVFVQAWHSDRTRDRGWHIMVSCSISFIGYVILATCAEKSVGASYFALFLVVGGNYSLFPLVMWVHQPILSAVSLYFIDMCTQELGCERFLANLQARRWDSVYRLDIQLRLNVSSFPLLDGVDNVDTLDFSASPQVYFDPSDSYRKAHALSAG